MDRRRYVPTTLGAALLETRQLMASGVSIFNPYGNNPAPDLPPTLAARFQRIANLPLIMNSYQHGRALPEAVIAPIQADLTGLISRIHSPGKNVELEFNRAIRAVDPTKHFSKQQADLLLKAFNDYLNASSVTPTERAKFVADMTALARLDATGAEPGFQLTNDFAIIAQLTQSVGQPFAAPRPPSLLSTEKVGKKEVTEFHRPTFTGQATPDLTVLIALRNNGGVIATGVADKNGNYSIKAGYPLPDGIYHVEALTYQDGYYSVQSAVYTFQIKTPARLANIPVYQTTPAVPTGPAAAIGVARIGP